MQYVGYTAHHGRPMDSVITNKVYYIGGHTDKPVKKHSH